MLANKNIFKELRFFGIGELYYVEEETVELTKMQLEDAIDAKPQNHLLLENFNHELLAFLI